MKSRTKFITVTLPDGSPVAAPCSINGCQYAEVDRLAHTSNKRVVPIDYHIEPDDDGDWHIIAFSDGSHHRIFSTYPKVVIDAEIH